MLISGVLPTVATAVGLIDTDRPNVPMCGIGTILVIMGISLRLWGFNYIGHCLISSEPRANKLVTCGPYSHVRHPIYFGTFIIVIGLILVLGPSIMVIGLLSPIFPYYILLAIYEEKMLTKLFPSYEEYKKRVPMLIPSFRPKISSNPSQSLMKQYGLRGFIKAVLRYELAAPGSLILVLLALICR
jgi:protein-S-isoprenylcysteine O-methyltransferase Ste14